MIEITILISFSCIVTFLILIKKYNKLKENYTILEKVCDDLKQTYKILLQEKVILTNDLNISQEESKKFNEQIKKLEKENKTLINDLKISQEESKKLENKFNEQKNNIEKEYITLVNKLTEEKNTILVPSTTNSTIISSYKRLSIYTAFEILKKVAKENNWKIDVKNHTDINNWTYRIELKITTSEELSPLCIERSCLNLDKEIALERASQEALNRLTICVYNS